MIFMIKKPVKLIVFFSQCSQQNISIILIENVKLIPCFSFVYIYVCRQGKKKKKNNMCDTTTEKKTNKRQEGLIEIFCLSGNTVRVYVLCAISVFFLLLLTHLFTLFQPKRTWQHHCASPCFAGNRSTCEDDTFKIATPPHNIIVAPSSFSFSSSSSFFFCYYNNSV